ncbi:F-box only protein 13 [Salvia hispanica]|uniref:F-box only protein 13 n=1 Tax=Salvia hispanica TaxID=49212 RepID=UPI002009C6D3|nr:F-box only protein 13 [Salvia hispanica]
MDARKRKRDTTSEFPLNDLNQDLLERVLSWLPTSSFLRLTSVCKRWKSISHSTSFKLACSQIPSRRPWFLMVPSTTTPNPPIIFDSAEFNWKILNKLNQIPVAAAAGLLCFLRPDAGFTVTNPVTASSRHVDPPPSTAMLAVAMAAEGKNFKLVLLSGELPNLRFREYSSLTQRWSEEASLIRNGVEIHTPYFLTKCGNVVTTQIQRSASKRYASLLIGGILYFLSSGGTVVACDLERKSFFEYPRLLPAMSEYSIDLVEVEGRMCVVLLSEFLETASLRVWGWDEAGRRWEQRAAMPPWMSHGLYGKKADVNCAGGGDGKVLVCVNSAEICRYVMCDLGENEWEELPECTVDGGRREFVSAFSFEPRIEV